MVKNNEGENTTWNFVQNFLYFETLFCPSYGTKKYNMPGKGLFGVKIHPIAPQLTATMTFTTSRDSNGTITVSPRNEVHQTATIVLCHGLGDSAQGWEDVAEVR